MFCILASAGSWIFEWILSSAVVLFLQVCECVVILRGLKDVSWAGAKAMMADASFLKTLIEFDKDGMSDKQVNVAVTHRV